MKVLHITNNFPTLQLPVFGIFVKEQIESLENEGIENQIYFINGRGKGKFEYFKSIPKIRQLIKNNNFDIIHCHHALSALCCIFTGKITRINLIVSYQSTPKRELGKLLFWLIKYYSKAVILKTPNWKLDEKIHYIPNGVNIDLFHPISKETACNNLNLDPQKKYLLFVSSNFIRKEKRYDLFLDIVRHLKSKYNLQNIEGIALTNAPRELVPYYFNASCVHILTSDFEGSPNSVKEAMACNIPVVSTNVGNVPDLLNDVRGCYISKTGTVEEMSYLVYKSIVSNEIITTRDIINNRQFDITSTAFKIISLYKSII